MKFKVTVAAAFDYEADFVIEADSREEAEATALSRAKATNLHTHQWHYDGFSPSHVETNLIEETSE